MQSGPSTGLAFPVFYLRAVYASRKITVVAGTPPIFVPPWTDDGTYSTECGEIMQSLLCLMAGCILR